MAIDDDVVVERCPIEAERPAAFRQTSATFRRKVDPAVQSQSPFLPGTAPRVDAASPAHWTDDTAVLIAAVAKLKNFFPLAAEQNRDTTTRTNRTAREMSKPLSGLRTAPHLVSSSVYLTTLGPLCMLPATAAVHWCAAFRLLRPSNAHTDASGSRHPPARPLLSSLRTLPPRTAAAAAAASTTDDCLA